MSSNICKLNINKKCQYKFPKRRSLGEGNYGEVIVAEKDDKTFAFKILRKQDERTRKVYPRNIENPIELDILFRLNSPYLNKGESITEIGECNKDFTGLAVNRITKDLFDALTDELLDYNQKKKIMKDVDILCHAAAYAHEGLSSFSPVLISNNNVTGSVSVFTAAIINKVKRIVYCSSMARYGNIKIPFNEEDELKPVDPYGVSKVAAENILKILPMSMLKFLITVSESNQTT
jgi:hypothetical protein